MQPENPFASSARLDHAYAWESVARQRPEDNQLLVMDYGCFDGSLLRELSQSFPDLTAVGCDKNCDAVTRGSELAVGGPVTLHCPDDLLDWVASYENQCDVVLAMGVVEHVVQQRDLLNSLSRALKPGGVLVLSVPGRHRFSWADLGNWKFHFPRMHRTFVSITQGREFYQERFVECPNGLFGDIEVDKGIHEHFTRRDLVDLVESSGFKVEDVDGFGYYFRLLKPLTMALPGVLGSRMMTVAMKDLYKGESAELVLEARRNVSSIPHVGENHLA